jgi:hypothetical protein
MGADGEGDLESERRVPGEGDVTPAEKGCLAQEQIR